MVDGAAPGVSVESGVSGGLVEGEPVAGHGDVRARSACLQRRRARLAAMAGDEGEARRCERVAAAEAWLAGAEEALAALTGDLDAVPGGVVSERLRRVSTAAERVQAAVAALAGVLDSSAQWSVEGASSARAWVMGETGVGSGAAGRVVGVGRLVDRFPVTAAALADGSMTVAQAEVLAAAALSKGRHRVYARDEAVLVAAAEALDLHGFTQAVRRWAHLADDELDNGEPAAAFERRGVSFATLPSGNLRISGELDATGGALLQAAFVAFDVPDPADDAIPPRRVPQRRADFLAALAARMLSERNTAASAPIATVDVLVDAEHLARLAPFAPTAMPHDGTDGGGRADRRGTGPPGGGDTGGIDDRGAGDGRRGTGPPGGVPNLVRWADAVGTGPLPGHALVQLLCDSWVGRLVVAGGSEPLDVGRRTRTWSSAQRRAIVARDRHCTHPGCTRGPEWCQIHHVEPWDPDGETSVDNGTLLCLWHHTHHHLTDHHLTEQHRHRRRPPVRGRGPQ